MTIIVFSNCQEGRGICHDMDSLVGFSAGPIVTLKERITGEKYREILENQVHIVMQTLFTARDGIFQDDNAPILASGPVIV
ncbi:hypothetical protein TNCV_283851 [Trichonephila clavipes]|uniref:Uncharacterized protein n=1 Tax=Trichonephila clavipes TaxID=2585209 RepID=A0A8X6SNJ8_TRICX|nr:hypothetical protein TNCV_283851 [Trichonephila clavipes]